MEMLELVGGALEGCKAALQATMREGGSPAENSLWDAVESLRLAVAWLASDIESSKGCSDNG